MKVEQHAQESEGYWLDFIEDLQIKIKPMSKGLAKRLHAQCTKKKFINHQPVEQLDEKKLDQLLMVEIVVDWKNFQDNEGKEIPCTPENVKALMNNWLEFSQFVDNACTNIQDYLKEREEETAKN